MSMWKYKITLGGILMPGLWKKILNKIDFSRDFMDTLTQEKEDYRRIYWGG